MKEFVTPDGTRFRYHPGFGGHVLVQVRQPAVGSPKAAPDGGPDLVEVAIPAAAITALVDEWLGPDRSG